MLRLQLFDSIHSADQTSQYESPSFVCVDVVFSSDISLRVILLMLQTVYYEGVCNAEIAPLFDMHSIFVIGLLFSSVQLFKIIAKRIGRSV